MHAKSNSPMAIKTMGWRTSGLEHVIASGAHTFEGLQQAKTSADGPLGVVFMRHGVAKIHQHAIAQVLSQIAVKALNHRSAGLMVGADNLTVVFWVQVPRQPGRMH